MSKSTIKSEFDRWKLENGQHGKQAFSRFIMLKFLDALMETSNDFVFKGGNLLWHYIQTPRETVDLDLATLTIKSHREVKELMEKSFTRHDDIDFSIKDFKEIDGTNELAAAVIIKYQTNTGQANQFPIDIVYALPTDIAKVKLSLGGTHRAASIENIICDKVSAAYKFKSGNTRMKDFDDLWRISKSDQKISKTKLKKLFKDKQIDFYLSPDWTQEMIADWKKHAKSYGDLPNNITMVFNEINEWLASFK